MCPQRLEFIAYQLGSTGVCSNFSMQIVFVGDHVDLDAELPVVPDDFPYVVVELMFLPLYPSACRPLDGTLRSQ